MSKKEDLLAIVDKNIATPSPVPPEPDMHNVPLRPVDVLFAVAFGLALGALIAAGVPV